MIIPTPIIKMPKVK